MRKPPPPLKRALEIAAHPPFRVQREEGLVLISYREKGGFSEASWDAEARELRGIVYAEATGEAVSRPFHRFFNLGDPRCGFPPDRPLKTNDLLARKVDGFLLQVFAFQEKLWFASRAALRLSKAEHASWHQAWTPRHDAFVRQALESLGSITLLFEVVDPKRLSLERHEEAAAVLLAIRHIPTGRYWFPGAAPELDALLQSFQVPHVSWRPAGAGTLEELHRRVRNEKDKEGYVLWLEEGDFLKVKTDWALGFSRKQRRFQDHLREFSRSLMEDRFDDFIAGLSSEPEMQGDFLRLYRRIRNLIGETLAMAEEVRGLPRKEAVALLEDRLRSFPLTQARLSLALAAYEGGEERAWARFKTLLKGRGPQILDALLEEA
ncbi:hypothetical protein CSW23_01240 [Thermus scotoductus]|uniref:T4 RNA ligase 1-like N-terminal domain-containing protein n=1 Tax=Thermus scotoductus TaxID=37636 RepID=A0A430V6Q6_THESC|nr:hypothetical protein CSW31_01500 [Thermus scotoductus]RTI20606.1 hypothetical protein CSW23_01240 [Thermus scotoductus]